MTTWNNFRVKYVLRRPRPIDARSRQCRATPNQPSTQRYVRPTRCSSPLSYENVHTIYTGVCARLATNHVCQSCFSDCLYGTLCARYDQPLHWYCHKHTSYDTHGEKSGHAKHQLANHPQHYATTPRSSGHVSLNIFISEHIYVSEHIYFSDHVYLSDQIYLYHLIYLYYLIVLSDHIFIWYWTRTIQAVLISKCRLNIIDSI